VTKGTFIDILRMNLLKADFSVSATDAEMRTLPMCWEAGLVGIVANIVEATLPVQVSAICNPYQDNGSR